MTPEKPPQVTRSLSHDTYREKLKQCEEIYKRDLDVVSDVSDNSDLYNMPSCEFCGLLFSNLSDLQSHLMDWCRGQRKRPLQDDEEEVKQKHAKRDTKPKMLNISKEKKLIRIVGELTIDRMHEDLEEAIEDYENEGKSEKVAKDLAFNDHISDIRSTLRKTYAEFLTTFMNAQEKSFVFNTIMNTAKSLREEHNYAWEDAFNQAVRQHKVLLNKLVIERDVQEDSDETETEQEEEEEEEEEEEDEEEAEDEDED